MVVFAALYTTVVGLTTPSLPPSANGTPCLTRRAALASTGALVLPLRSGAAVTETEREVMTTVQVPMGKGKPAFPVNKPRYTGAGDPGWTYQKREVSKAVYTADWPSAWPYSPKDFLRMDEEPDTVTCRHLNLGSTDRSADWLTSRSHCAPPGLLPLPQAGVPHR